MTELLQKYWNMDYLTEKHLAGFDSYKVSEFPQVYLIEAVFHLVLLCIHKNPFTSINFLVFDKPEFINYIIPFKINRQFLN